MIILKQAAIQRGLRVLIQHPVLIGRRALRLNR